MELRNIKDVKPNVDNPRIINEGKFNKLVKSLKDFPEMSKVRPIVVNKDMVVLGGNMRLKAMQSAGWKEVPVEIVDWSEEKQREFIIKDNVGFGEWDWELIANDWDESQLEEWGLDIPGFQDLEEPDYDDLIGDEKDKPATMKITFKSVEQLQAAEPVIDELLERKFDGAYYSVSAGEL